MRSCLEIQRRLYSALSETAPLSLLLPFWGLRGIWMGGAGGRYYPIKWVSTDKPLSPYTNGLVVLRCFGVGGSTTSTDWLPRVRGNYPPQMGRPVSWPSTREVVPIDTWSTSTEGSAWPVSGSDTNDIYHPSIKSESIIGEGVFQK